MQRICALSSCGVYLGEGATSRGIHLCKRCWNLLTRRLSRMPRLYIACEQALDVGRYHSIQIVHGRRTTGICLDEFAVSVRTDTMRILSSWCELIVEERRVVGPADLDIMLLTSFLRSHLDWLATHPAVADFAEEIGKLTARLEEVLNPAAARAIDLGPCIEDGCGRMVRASIRSGVQGSAPHVRCDAGHIWPPHQWLRLRQQLDPPSQPIRTGMSV